MKVDQKKSLKATVTPKKVLSSNKKGVWISSDTDIVSVSSKGVMTARQEGQAVVTFTIDQWKKRRLYSDGKQGFCCPAGTGTNAAVCYIRRSDSDSCFRICHWCGCCKWQHIYIVICFSTLF